MKRLSIVLASLLLLVGLGSCGKDKQPTPQPTPQPTKLTLSTTEVTLKVGGMQQLTATVEPKDQTFTVTFASDNEKVATVDAKGLIKAVAEGTANVTAKVGTLTAKCVVTVTKEDNGGGGGTTPGNELPLLKFDPSYDQNAKKINDPDVLNHEKELGRTEKGLMVGNQGPFPGFANTNLTISGAIYGLSSSDAKIIVAFSKESLTNFPKTKAMLTEYGFTNLVDQQFDDGTPTKVGLKNDDQTVGVMLFDSPNAEIGSTLQVRFIKKLPKKDIEIAHPIIPTAQDFPSYKEFITGDVAKIKAFETGLGFREFDANPKLTNEAKKNLLFVTKQESLAQTNFNLVYYVSTPTQGPKFINSVINFVRNADDFADPKIKEWFTANGYGNNFQVGDSGVAGYDATGKIICQIGISNGGDMALLQIYENTQAQSASQIRRLANKQYELMKFSPMLTKDLKLRQTKR